MLISSLTIALSLYFDDSEFFLMFLFPFSILKRREGLVMATIVFPFSAIELLSALPSC
jgi:hypothetical protein